MTWTISKDFAFSASHQLHGLRDDHPCGRLHGHNYIIRISLVRDTVNSHGFVFDYGDLAPFGKWVDGTLDHRHLNDVLDMQPSAENMARLFAGTLRLMVALPKDVQVKVAVSETPKTWAEWSE
jgi:6-pyruvoyltetrahydropterin/6-carboxytetrahydropterin synthase